MSTIEKLRTASKKELLALPWRPWNKEGIYSSLIVFPTGRKHDSRWGEITLIGVNDLVPTEIITTGSDDLGITGNFKIDCLYPTHALHYWTRGFPKPTVFWVSHALSSMTIKVIPAS
jgi:hypothetical protein